MSDSDTQNPDGQPAAGQSDVNPGFQKRIDELTAARYEAEGRAKAAADALAAQERMLQQLQAQLQTQAQPQQTADPFAEMDPTMAKALQAMQSKFSSQFETLQRQLAAQAQASEVAQVAAAEGVQDAEIKARAAALAQGWRAQGYNFTAADALRFAAGEKFLALQKSGGVKDPLQQFQGGAAQGFTPQQQISQNQTPSLPRNFDSLSPRQQQEILKKRGVEDMPL